MLIQHAGMEFWRAQQKLLESRAEGLSCSEGAYVLSLWSQSFCLSCEPTPFSSDLLRWRAGAASLSSHQLGRREFSFPFYILRWSEDFEMISSPYSRPITSFPHGGKGNSHCGVSSNHGSRGGRCWELFHILPHLLPKPLIPHEPPEINHSPTSRMRPQILTLLCSLFAFVLATDKLEDESNIKALHNVFNFIFDRKQFNDLGGIFTPDVTYDPGPVQGLRPVQGLPNVIFTLSTFPNTTTTYTILSTQLIKFRPPFDKEGRSNLAESVSYSTFVNFGSGNLTGEVFIIFAKYVDKEIVKTNEPGFGGWRFRNRKFESVVSSPTTNTCVAYYRTLPVASTNLYHTLILATSGKTFWKPRRSPPLSNIIEELATVVASSTDLDDGSKKMVRMW